MVKSKSVYLTFKDKIKESIINLLIKKYKKCILLKMPNKYVFKPDYLINIKIK